MTIIVLFKDKNRLVGATTREGHAFVIAHVIQNLQKAKKFADDIYQTLGYEPLYFKEFQR